MASGRDIPSPRGLERSGVPAELSPQTPARNPAYVMLNDSHGDETLMQCHAMVCDHLTHLVDCTISMMVRTPLPSSAHNTYMQAS
jgi:hypothetical protein